MKDGETVLKLALCSLVFPSYSHGDLGRNCSRHSIWQGLVFMFFWAQKALFLFDPDETGVEEFATSKKATELSGRMRPQTFAAAPGWERLRACTVASFNLCAAPQTSWHQNLPRWQNSAAPSLQKSSGDSAAAGTGAKQQTICLWMQSNMSFWRRMRLEENARRTIWVLAGRLALGLGSMPACTDPLGHHPLPLTKKMLGHFKKIWNQDLWSPNI